MRSAAISGTTNSVNQQREKAIIKEYEDGRSYDPEAVQIITQQWVDTHMREREQEFTKPASVTVFCGTWNVNAKKQEGGLQDWILPPNQPFADIYAIGFQEIVDLNAMNVAINSSNTIQREKFWQEKISDCLISTKTKYTLIQSKTLVGLLLCVYVKESLLSHIMDVRSTQLGVGLMGMMGNKGGVSVRLCLFDSSICFVCAHLAAHRENIAGRNSDYKNIIDRSLFNCDPTNMLKNGLVFGNEGDIIDSIVMPKRTGEKLLTLDLNIHQHEVIYWIGDLNYRIDDVYTTDEVFMKIAAKQLEELRNKDQLNIERAKGNVFHGFNEGVLTFDPTYKYQPGTDVYDTRPEKKIRAPAWCDRVLWKSKKPDAVVHLDYRCAQLNPSDHKPVSALFKCEVRTIVDDKKKVVFNELINVLKKHNSNSLPKVEVKGLQIKLDCVHYEEPQVSYVNMCNQGDSIAHWRFVPKLDEQRVCKRWISCDIESGLLLPGEQIRVAITILVDTKSAQVLNVGKDSLEDLIILRIEQSTDFHIFISANYHRTCFGMSLQELVHTLEPVSTTLLPTERGKLSDKKNLLPTSSSSHDLMNQNEMDDIDTKTTITSINNISSSKELSIPKELWRLIDALWSGNALREKDLFNSKAELQEVAEVRKSLDNGIDFPSCTPHSICEAIFRFIGALPQPLLPPELYPSSEIEPVNLRAVSRRFLEDLPPLNYNVFVYILSFLREVLNEVNYNRCTPLLLTNFCIGCMLSSDIITDDNNKEDSKRLMKLMCMQSIIMHLLTTNVL